MPQKFSRPRGTNDILPESSPLWRSIEEKAHRLFNLYGYKEIRTPIFEETSLFTRSLGETSDVVTKQMLELQKEGLSLRPEGTASVVRSYLENSIDKKQGLAKLYYIGPMFRGERPQKGRLRQFHQIGVEVIGPNVSNPHHDVEVIALSMRLLREFGLSNCKLVINNLGLPEDKQKLSAILREKFKKESKNLCEDCRERLERNVFRVLDCKNESCRAVVQKLNVGTDYLSKESQKDFEVVKEGLNQLQVSYDVSPYLVRGLDYYVNTVFEISHEGLGSQNAIGAGGRYNTLLQDLGGTPTLGGLGFAIGVERVILAGLATQEKISASTDTFVIYICENDKDPVYTTAFALMNQLRENGIASDMILTPSPLKKQMSAASDRGARFAVILGENEAKEKVVTLKDMKTGTQEKVSQKEMSSLLKRKLC